MAKEAPSSFSSLPNDIVLNILARVPRRFHPKLCCVSKNLGSLVRSSELRKTRSLLGKDRFNFYVCLVDSMAMDLSYQWFTLSCGNRRLVSVPFPSPDPSLWPYTSAVPVGSEIYLVGGSRFMWILDTRSGQLRLGPSSPVGSKHEGVGLVHDKIYVFGGTCEKECYQDIQAQVFDLKTQTWLIAPNPSLTLAHYVRHVVNPSLGRKIYAVGSGCESCDSIIVYETRDGTCDRIIIDDEVTNLEMCVVDNVLYMYYQYVGLMWYDSMAKEWRLVHVHGLKLGDRFLNHLVMTEYDGKLAFFWQQGQKDEIWCAMIALYGTSHVAIWGRLEWSDCILSQVPSHYYILHVVACPDY
ncbi:hypothetical protein EUTSA_v10006383mg [Eutrema salsugineum]|uniref:F-box domain-containing protein n=2 Tax=Eutrema salsugineum TaxID=72664 RepID=V4LVX0_EUTSA|nr:hypothetical protein EUTSA_v10006383mg [Eutrema salsugineum]